MSPKRPGVAADCGKGNETGRSRGSPGPELEMFNKLVQLTTDGIIITNSDLTIISWNKGAEKIFGLSAIELDGRQLQDLLPASARHGMMQRLQHRLTGLETGLGTTFDAKIKKNDGTEVHVEHTVTSWESGGKRYFGAIIRDISEWEQAKETLALSEAKYRSLIDNTTAGIAIVDVDGDLMYANEALCNLTGYTRDELIGRPFSEFMHPEDVGRITEVFHGAFTDPESRTALEFRVLRKDDSVAYCYASTTTTQKGGDIVALNAVIQDITELRQAEDALKESEQMFRNLAEQSPNMIFINVRGKVAYANRRCEEIMGYTRQEFYSPKFDFLNITAPEYKELVKEKFRVHMSGKDVVPYEYAIITRDGRRLETIMSPKIINYCGEMAILGTITDISERKQAEQAIRESERFLESVFSSIQDGMSVLDRDMVILRVNQTMEKWYAHAMPLVGKKCYEAYHGRREPCEVCPTIRTLRTDSVQVDTVPRIGPVRELTGWLELYSYPLKDPATGQTKGVIEYVRDITKRKHAEEALRASEEKYRLVSENIPVAVYSALPDALSTSIFISGRMKDLTSYSAGEFVADPKLWANIIYPDDRQFVWEKLQEHRRKRIPLDVEYRIITRDNAVKWIRDRATPQLDANGQVVRIDGFMEDITERKQAQDALKASEERFRTLFEKSPEGVVLLDLEGNIIDINEAAMMLHDRPRNKIVGKNFTELEALYDEDKQRYLDQFLRMVTGEPFQPAEIRLRSDSGDRWQEVFPALLEKDGEIEMIQVIMRDITERKNAQRGMMARLMAYELDEGNVYLVMESSPVLAMEGFRDLMRAGYRGAVLSRTPSKEFKEPARHLYEYRWLSEKDAGEALLPELGIVEKWLEGLPRNMAVLVDRLDFLVFKNGSDRTLEFVHRARDLAYLMGHVMILSLDPAALSPQQLHSFEKEAREIVPRAKPNLPDDLLDVLKHVYQQNAIGLQPTLTEVREALGLSKPTTSKRVNHLVHSGCLALVTRGRTKAVELTEKGRRVFLK